MKKIIILKEQLGTIKEMAYPSSFNMEEFKNIKTFTDRVKYCEARLQKLGVGSSRRVYKIDNDKCLKLAKNRKGVAQNIEEITLSNDIYAGECFAKVYDYDESGLFVEMEIARKAKGKDFERLVGVPFDCYCDIITRTAANYLPNNSQSRRWINKAMDDTYNYIMDNIDEFEFIDEVIDYMSNYQLKTYGDLQRLSSYGVVKRNGVETMVIIDYGLTENVYDNYYK